VFIRTRGKQTLASTLVLRTTQPKRVWTLTPAEKPGRIDVAVDVTEVKGTPEALLLALWGRRTAAEAKLTINGDPAAALSLIA